MAAQRARSRGGGVLLLLCNLGPALGARATGSGRTNLHSYSRNADPRRNEASAATGSQGAAVGCAGGVHRSRERQELRLMSMIWRGEEQLGGRLDRAAAKLLTTSPCCETLDRG